MATKKTRKEMVFQKECTNVSTKATRPPLPPPLFIRHKPVRAGEGEGTMFTDKVEDRIKNPPGGGASPTQAILENLPAKISCHGVSVTLDNNVMWNEFFRCQTEMILTQDGSRMFPYCRFRISGLDASKKYSLVVDIQPVDSSQYKWTGHKWQVAGKAIRHLKSLPFSHPDSPSTGQRWMEQPVSFYKLKLTNMSPGQGNLVLHPLHRYIPRLHVVPFSANAKKELKLNGPRVATFTFPQTEFFAVSAYQNSRFTQLKVNYNPFAKGFKDERSSSLALKLKSSASKDLNKEADPSTNQNPFLKKSLKSLPTNHKPRSCPVADHQHSDTSIPAATSATEELSSKAKPSQKLFSELIREAHVSLRRCNLDKMVASMNSTCKVKVADLECPFPTVCTAVNEKSTTASCPAPKSPIKQFLSSLDCQSKSEPQPEENVRPHKRPPLVPLPALARFLSKHQPKHRNVGTRQEPLNTPPSEAPPLSKAAPGVRSTIGSHSGSFCISPASTLIHQEPTQEGQVLAPQIVVPKPMVPDGTHLLPSTDLPLSTSEQIHFSTSAPEGLPTAIDSFLADITDSSTVAPRVSTNQPAPLLPESSPIGFESLSPASSPEPLPPLHVSLGLETLPSPPVAHTTLKWHSLFPQPDPFLSSFTPFYPTPQSPTLNPPDQPCQEAPSITPDPLLHDDEYQSLPFPGELSPLALQLSLSPSFSSLDGGALSPTPSLSDLLSFISTDNNNLLLEAEVGKAEHVLVPYPPLPLTVPITRSDPCPPVQSEPEPTTKPLKGKRKCRKGQSKGATGDSDPVYTKMQPSLEEVEEQLFVSFTSKEALKLHLQDSLEGPGSQPLESSREDPQPATPSPEGEPPQQSTPPPDTGGIGATATGEHVSPGDGLKDHKECVAAFQTILLRDLKLMKNRQVIHPVLQEVGLKMHLLDATLAIDLQYLGVRLPIPPHPMEAQAVSPWAVLPWAASPPAPPRLLPQSVCLDFVSRTGKTSDVTQIKGWREKFSPSESSTSSSSSKTEAAALSEHPSKNLSAFCSDMLDEYLENEGKLLDQHASRFSQAPPEPVAYELPTQSSSYVRTLSSVLKKQPLSAPTSALISSFVPPSKRPRLPPTTTKKSRRQKTAGSKLKSKPASGTGGLVSPTAAGPEQPLTQPPTLPTTPAQLATPSTHPSLTSQTQDKSEADPPPNKTTPPPVSAPSDTPSKKTKKLKSAPSLRPTPKTPVSKDLASGLALGCQDLAPLESDSELGPARDVAPKPKALVSVTLLKQRNLEEGVVWEGRPRTCITEERASIALTSLFTSAGFVREDPTAPIQLVKRRTPPCLNDFCRLGCVCSSLAHSRPITHCGKVQCMLGCGCLRQKVVLLKNLDGSDSSPSDLDPSKRKRRKKRMKMAYVLKETESVAQPAQPVRSLWKGGDVDPEPMYTPEHVTHPKNQVRRVAGNNGKTCARVRGYAGRKTLNHTLKSEGVQEAEEEPRQIRNQTAASTTDPSPTKSPESCSELAKHLVIVADCQWPSPEVQTQVLKAVCQAMAQERLHKPFWINKYYAKLLSFTIKRGVVHYKVHISEGKADLPKTLLSTTRPGPIGPSKTGPTGTGGEEVEGEEAVEDWQKEEQGEEVVEDSQKEVQGEEAVEDSQKEVQGEESEEDSQKEVEEEEAVEGWQEEEQGEEAVEDWQKEVQGEESEEDWQKEVQGEEAVEDWQKEVQEEEAEEDSQKEVEEAEEDSQKEVAEDKEDLKEVKKRMMKMALPFLSGLSHAGFLSANRKESGGGNLLVQVNGKPYPMAMVQLGRMGALHPANRLAAYLTGRVRPSQPPAPPASSPAVVTMAATPPTSDQKSADVGSVGGQMTTGQLYLYDTIGHLSQRTDRRLIRLVPLNQIRGLKAPHGTPGTHKDSKTIVANATGPVKVVPGLSVAPHPAGPAPSAGTCKLRLVSANHQSTMPLIITVPMPRPPTPAGSGGTDQNISPAGSSGTDQNISPAGSGGTDLNSRPAGSSGTDLNSRPAGSSGTDQNSRPAGSSGTDQNSRPASSSGTDLNSRPAGSSGTDLNSRPASSSGTDQNIRPAGSSGTDLNSRPASSSGTDLNSRPAGSSGTDLNSRPASSSGTDQNIRPAGSSGTDLNSRPASSSGTDQNIRPAGSSGTDLNSRPAGSSGTDQNIRPAGSSGTDQNSRPAGSSGTDQNSRPAGSSGTEQNIREMASSGMDLNIICVDSEPDLLTDEGHVDVARTLSKENLLRPEHDVGLLLSSDLSESSSDSELENGRCKGSRQSRRISQHSLLERVRRKAIAGGLSRLQRAMGLRDKTATVTILKQAHEEVLELRSRECRLARLKDSLRRQREEHIRTLAHRTGKSEESISRELLRLSNGNTQQGQTGSKPPLAAEVAAQLDETDEQTENSSDENNLPSDTHDNIISFCSDDDVDIETVVDNSSMTMDERKCLVTAYKSLRSELNSKTRTRIQLLSQAYSVICDLKDEEQHCEKKMVALKHQRSQLINNISARSGRSTKNILEKLQNITAKQRQLEETRSKARPAEGATPLDLTSTMKPRSQPRAPPRAPPAAQLGPQLPPPTGSPHNTSRLKTVPNILARRKAPAPPPAPSPPPPARRSESGEAAPPVHAAVMPAGLVSFLCPLPGQQVLTLKPMASEPGALPPNPGVASVSLDISYPANENIPHPRLPRPSTCTGPFPTLLYLVPSTTALQPQQQLQEETTKQLGSLPLHQTLLSAGSLPLHQTLLSAGSLPLQQTLLSAGSLPLHQTLSAGSQPLQQTLSAGSLPLHQTLPAGSLPLHQTLSAGSLPLHQTLSAGSLPLHQTLQQTLSAGSLPLHQTLPAGSLPLQQTLLSGVPGGRLEACESRARSPVLPETGPHPEPRPGALVPEEGQGPGLSSLLNQLYFLNQNHGPPADRTLLSSVPGPPCSSLGREPHNNRPLRPSLSNEDLPEATQVNGHVQSADGPEPNVCNALHYPQCRSMGGTLTLPPLLQMKVGGAKVSESTNERAVGAWKPMPRLAAMGVKGRPPI